jgi:hypothetical protein
VLFELYKLKIKDIYLPDEILFFIWNKIYFNDNFTVEDADDLFSTFIDSKEINYLFIIFILFQKKEDKFDKYYNIEDKDTIQNKKIYLFYFLQYIPIINGYYSNIIHEIIREVLDEYISIYEEYTKYKKEYNNKLYEKKEQEVKDTTETTETTEKTNTINKNKNPNQKMFYPNEDFDYNKSFEDMMAPIMPVGKPKIMGSPFKL